MDAKERKNLPVPKICFLRQICQIWQGNLAIPARFERATFRLGEMLTASLSENCTAL
jgi:hypothetical protein